ncbi:MAG TPA: hypothetical protein VGM88_32160 [Kofleriaceae bacterium]
MRAPFTALGQILGTPDRDLPEKVTTMWSIRAQGVAEERLWLRDRQEDPTGFKLADFRALPHFDWEVWADSQEIAHTFARWLSGRVIEVVRSIRTLDAEAKVRMNELLRAGASMDEAMKQVKLNGAEAVATRFAWPIPDEAKPAKSKRAT